MTSATLLPGNTARDRIVGIPFDDKERVFFGWNNCCPVIPTRGSFQFYNAWASTACFCGSTKLEFGGVRENYLSSLPLLHSQPGNFIFSPCSLPFQILVTCLYSQSKLFHDCSKFCRPTCRVLTCSPLFQPQLRLRAVWGVVFGPRSPGRPVTEVGKASGKPGACPQIL